MSFLIKKEEKRVIGEEISIELQFGIKPSFYKKNYYFFLLDNEQIFPKAVNIAGAKIASAFTSDPLFYTLSL